MTIMNMVYYGFEDIDYLYHFYLFFAIFTWAPLISWFVDQQLPQNLK